jgi:hypothetical protein
LKHGAGSHKKAYVLVAYVGSSSEPTRNRTYGCSPINPQSWNRSSYTYLVASLASYWREMRTLTLNSSEGKELLLPYIAKVVSEHQIELSYEWTPIAE